MHACGIHDFNSNRRYQLCSSQPVGLNRASFASPVGLRAQYVALALCLNSIDSLRRAWWTKVLEETWRSNTHANTNTGSHKYTLAHQLVWLASLFHVCSRDFITGYLSGALCLLDQAGLPTHSHLSEHSSDEITHTGISAVFFFCMCFDVIPS